MTMRAAPAATVRAGPTAAVIRGLTAASTTIASARGTSATPVRMGRVPEDAAQEEARGEHQPAEGERHRRQRRHGGRTRGSWRTDSSSSSWSGERSHSTNRQEEPEADGRRADRPAVGPPPHGRFDDGPDDGGEPGEGEHHANHVPAAAGADVGVGDEGHHPEEEAAQQGDVHEEDGAPPEVLQQETADDRSDREADGCGTGPDAERPSPLPAVRYMFESSDRLIVWIMAAATPMSSRHVISAVGLVANAPAADVATRATRLDRRARLRPSRSPSIAAHSITTDEPQRVAVDDPLEVGRRRPEGLREVGQGQVERRGVDRRDHRRREQRDHPERPRIATGRAHRPSSILAVSPSSRTSVP